MVSSLPQSGISNRLVRRNDVSFSRTVRECLEHRLYIPRWMFQTMLEDYNDYIKLISLVYVDDIPRCMGMVFDYPPIYDLPGENIGCYTKPLFRRQGLGSLAVQLLGGTEGREWKEGIPNSGEFWCRQDEKMLMGQING